MEKVNLKGMDLGEMETFMLSLGEPKYRAEQLFNWIYLKGLISFEGMTNFSKTLRTRLAQTAIIGNLTLLKSTHSPDSDTQKFLFQLEDGSGIESVLILEGKRKTLCLSTQVGCALNCKFCATGKMGFERNLTVGEITDQIIYIQREVGIEITNVVLMGMGEPFLNYENVLKACYLISHEKGLAIGQRKIVISTSGVVSGILRFTDEQQRYRLAISLNATTNDSRAQIMPINKKYPLTELMNAAKYYTRKSRRRVTFEYVLMADFNDRIEDAYRLRNLVKGIPCKINLIPYNNVNGIFQRPPDERIAEFARALYPLRAPISIRWSKEDDIHAACGQLYYDGR